MHLAITTVANAPTENQDFHVHLVQDFNLALEVAREWIEKLTNEHWLAWEVQLWDEGKVIETWSLDDSDPGQHFYLLTYEGYGWNSQIRDNLDVIAHRIYKRVC